eukprot:jgi/Mesvir1/1592/Mv14560-RA.1
MEWFRHHPLPPPLPPPPQEIESQATAVAFLSTPSIYFSLSDPEIKKNSYLFDLDDQWSKHPNYIRYDFNAPEDIPPDKSLAFDMVMIDPPFITEDCWQKYTTTTKLLLKPGGKLLLSTIQENAPMMKKLLDVNPVPFLPSIPHLVYQYTMYTNYPTRILGEGNPEIPV